MNLLLKIIVTNENDGFSEISTSEFQIYKKPVTIPKLFYHTLRRYFLFTYGLSIEPEGATTGIYVLAKKQAANNQIFGIFKPCDNTWLPYTIQMFYLWQE